MDIKKRYKWRNPGLPQLPGRTCLAGIDLSEVGVVCYLLDDSLAILWENSDFFRPTGYTMEGFHHPFSSLEKYYRPFPDDLTAIRRETAQTAPAGDPDPDMAIQLPRKADGFSQVCPLGTITTGPAAKGPALQLKLADVSALAFEEGEQAWPRRQQHHCFQSVLDTYEGNTYVSDIDAYELLYLSHASREVLDMPATKTVGRKCYEVTQGCTSPCPFYTNCKLSKGNFYKWEFYNPTLGRTLMIKNSEIGWKGHRTRLEFSRDMFSTGYKLTKKDQERDALISGAHGGFARADARGMRTILWYGSSSLDLIDYTGNKFEQVLYSQYTYVHPDDIVHITDTMDRSRVTGESTAAEGRIVTYHGALKIPALSFSFVSAQDNWDGIPSYYSVGLDVIKERMEQARQKQVLESACKIVRTVSDTKTNSLSPMSHDIHIPMNAIIGMPVIAQLSLNSPGKIQDCLVKVNTSSRHPLNLISEVLDVSKIEGGKINLIYEEVSPPKLIEDVVDVFRPLVAEKYQTLQVNADRVRHEHVVADKGRLQQVPINLLSNVVKYTPEGGNIGLRIQETPSFAEGKGQCSFVATDSGIGMHKDFISHVFEPFPRTDDARISNIQGTGLGVVITQNTVRIMNGTIKVKSTPGKGSQLVVAVTFGPCSEPGTDDGEPAGLPVLVADDDQTICENVSEIPNELGMQCSWVLSGREAVDRVAKAYEQSDDFFAVILD